MKTRTHQPMKIDPKYLLLKIAGIRRASQSLNFSVFLALLTCCFNDSRGQITRPVSEVVSDIRPGSTIDVTLKNGERLENMEVSYRTSRTIHGILNGIHDGKKFTVERTFLIADIIMIKELPGSGGILGSVVQYDSTLLYHVETRDGNEYIGKVIYHDQKKIHIRTEKLGMLALYKMDVVQMSPIDPAQLKYGDFWFQNPQATRYFWSPNGYGLKKGEGYYQNVWVLFNQFSTGITDHFSVGVGFVPLFLFAGAASPVWLAPKFSVPVVKDKFNIGIGALAGKWIGVESTPGSEFGIIYGTMTFGNRDKHCSLGIGYGYAGGGWSKAPTVNFGAMIRTGARSYFITENYFISSAASNTVMLSFGGRRIIKKAGLDFGLWMPSATTVFAAVPWLGLTVPLGNSKSR